MRTTDLQGSVFVIMLNNKKWQFVYSVRGDHLTKIFLLVQIKVLLKEINWHWFLVIGTSGFGAILTQNLECLGLFLGFRGPKIQK